MLYNPMQGKGDKRVHAFRKCISLNVNTIVRLTFELIYLETVLKHFIYYTQTAYQ